MATPGATRSGLIESSNARPVEENGATEPASGLASALAPENAHRHRAAGEQRGRRGRALLAREHDDRERDVDRPGRARPRALRRRRRARARWRPRRWRRRRAARAERRRAAAGRPRRLTRLVPSGARKSPSSMPGDDVGRRRARRRTSSDRRAARAAAARRSWGYSAPSERHVRRRRALGRRPRRASTSPGGSFARPSVAPTASQPGEAAGEAIVPKRAAGGAVVAGGRDEHRRRRARRSRRRPSRPRRRRPRTARRPERGSRPRGRRGCRRRSGRARGRFRPAASRSCPSGRRAAARAPGSGGAWPPARRRAGPAGPPRPATMPAIAVPCAAAAGSGAGVCGLPLIAFQPGSRGRAGTGAGCRPGRRAARRVTPAAVGAARPRAGAPRAPSAARCLATVAAG